MLYAKCLYTYRRNIGHLSSIPGKLFFFNLNLVIFETLFILTKYILSRYLEGMKDHNFRFSRVVTDINSQQGPKKLLNLQFIYWLPSPSRMPRDIWEVSYRYFVFIIMIFTSDNTFEFHTDTHHTSTLQQQNRSTGNTTSC